MLLMEYKCLRPLFSFCRLYFGSVVYKYFACSLFFVLQAYNEVQRCFLTVGLVYPEDLFTFLLNVSIFCLIDTGLDFLC